MLTPTEIFREIKEMLARYSTNKDNKWQYVLTLSRKYHMAHKLSKFEAPRKEKLICDLCGQLQEFRLKLKFFINF